MQSNTAHFAAMELSILEKINPSAHLLEFKDEVIALAEKFGLSGQSRGSAPYEANNYAIDFTKKQKSIANENASFITKMIRDLLLQKPICSISGEDEEWVNVGDMGPEDGEILYQNKRCSALFKNKDGKCWYLDAITWKAQTDHCWGGRAILANGKKIGCHHYIKSFPFKPKTFYIDVIEKEVKKDDWEFYIKDEKQLDKAFAYYNQKTN